MIKSFLRTGVPEKIAGDLWVLAAISLGSVINYVLHFVLARMLGPAEYGVFTALVRLSIVLTVPAILIQRVACQCAAHLDAQRERAKLVYWSRRAAGWIALAALLVGVALGLLRIPVASLLYLPTPAAVLVLAGVVGITLLVPLPIGLLQGLQRFRAFGVAYVLETVVRLAAAVAFVALGWRATGALAGTMVSGLCVVAFSGVMLRDVLLERAEHWRPDRREVLGYSGLVFVAQAGIVILSNVDVLFAQRYLGGQVAGYYSAASALAKTMLLVSQAVETLLFSRAARAESLGEQSVVLLRWAMLAVLGLCGVLTAIAFLMPGLLVRTLFGLPFAPAASFVGWYMLSVALLALVSTLTAYYLSVRDARSAWVLVAATGAEIGGMLLFHASPQNLIAVNIVVALATIVLLELVCGGLRGARKPAAWQLGES